jgi:hypothetical protein
MAALFKDEQRTEELRAMGERVRLLSATIDALLGQMDDGGEPPTAPAPKSAPASKAVPPPKPAAPRKRTAPARTPRS